MSVRIRISDIDRGNDRIRGRAGVGVRVGVRVR